MKVDLQLHSNNKYVFPEPVQRTKWRGNHFICLNGRLYAGPKFYIGIITLLYIYSYSYMFSFFILKRFRTDFDGLWLVELILLVLTSFFCLSVIFKNPGALPIHSYTPSQLNHIHAVNPYIIYK